MVRRGAGEELEKETHGGNGDAVVEGFLEERHEGGRRLRPVPCPPHTGNVYALSALFATTDPLPCSTRACTSVPTEDVFLPLLRSLPNLYQILLINHHHNNKLLKEIYEKF